MKYDIDFIGREFAKEGYILLSVEYRWDKKLEYICPNGHRASITWSKWQNNRRCPYCYGNKKLTIEYVRSEFEKEGYELLSQNYINSWTKLKYKCPRNHIHSIRWNHWQGAGARCPSCKIVNMIGEGHPNWKGGISCEPYCDAWADKEYKESIKKRDNHQCQNPDCWQTSKRLTVHHIDYNKKNCVPENLITLCNSCNIRANYNRNYWKKLYDASEFKHLLLGKGQGV
jgi:hypothetical protein